MRAEDILAEQVNDASFAGVGHLGSVIGLPASAANSNDVPPAPADRDAAERRIGKSLLADGNGPMQVRLGVLALALIAACGPAGAADLSVPPAAPQARPYDVMLEIGASGMMRPAYEGAKDYEFKPGPIVTLHYLWLPGLGVVKSPRTSAEGISFSPSFRFVSERDSSEYSELRGLNDIDAAYELGGKLAYKFGMFRPWGALRYGFGGYEGLVGEAGLEMIMQPDAATEITFGPRVSFASAEYMETYFDVTPAESLRSGLAAYKTGGDFGFKGVGAEAGIRYQFTPHWAGIGSVTYEKLIGDAADSPIVKLGEEDQFSAKLGLSYTFSMKLFD